MKKIPLHEWAAKHYDPPPTPWVLRRWARDGEISPMPERVGREWYVAADARRLTGARSLVERLQTA
jgi:hypothetical protein